MKQQRSQFRAIRGVRDILPPESALWNRVEQTAHDVFATYNFQEIRLPIFEQTELFARSVGADTDIVSKEMYTFARKLEFLRENIGPVSDAMTDRVGLQRYVQILAVFSDNVQRSVEGESIPRTERNRQAAQELKALVGKSVYSWNGGFDEPDAEWQRLLIEAAGFVTGMRNVLNKNLS